MDGWLDSWLDAYLIPSRYVERHVLQASHHAVVSEVVWKGFRPLRQQLHQFWRHLTETDLNMLQTAQSV